MQSIKEFQTPTLLNTACILFFFFKGENHDIGTSRLILQKYFKIGFSPHSPNRMRAVCEGVIQNKTKEEPGASQLLMCLPIEGTAADLLPLPPGHSCAPHQEAAPSRYRLLFLRRHHGEDNHNQHFVLSSETDGRGTLCRWCQISQKGEPLLGEGRLADGC